MAKILYLVGSFIVGFIISYLVLWFIRGRKPRGKEEWKAILAGAIVWVIVGVLAFVEKYI